MRPLARLVVRLHPSAWRDRYEEEVLALVDAGAVRLRDVLDLLRRCVAERVLALYEPSRHMTAYRFISGLSLLAYITVLAIGTLVVASVPFLLGYLLQLVAGPFPGDVMDAVTWILSPAFLVVMVVCWIRFYRLQLPT